MKKYGASTTQMGKLLPRLNAGRNGGCPVLVFGITPKVVETSLITFSDMEQTNASPATEPVIDTDDIKNILTDNVQKLPEEVDKM